MTEHGDIKTPEQIAQIEAHAAQMKALADRITKSKNESPKKNAPESKTNGHSTQQEITEAERVERAPKAAAIATKFVNAGGHVIFFPRGTKRCTVPGWEQKATNNLEAALVWAGQDPSANVGIVGKQDGLWGLDDDAGLLVEYEAQYGPIQTYTTRTVQAGVISSSARVQSPGRWAMFPSTTISSANCFRHA
jgi:Bifunctional DNA primase/polymerase, N-terminal